jgi:hypothetical protein
MNIMSSVLQNTVEMPANTERKKEEEQKDCPVCMDHFTSVIRQPIRCAYCPHTVCRQCASRFLLTTLNDPHCMGCKREWNREFIDTNLTQTFRKGPLKLQRRKVLIDREKGRLPAMQVFMEAKVGMDQANKRSQELWLRKRQLKKQKTKIHAEILAGGILEADELNREIEEKLGPINTELAAIRIEMTQCTDEVRRLFRIFHGTERVVREFIMKCPADECRGFLSSAWKCGTCQKNFCNDCHAEKSGQKDETHVCNEEAKSTAAMIQNETKPCPKCGIRISKIDGCDQMWCTECQTTFSWNTGQILLNTVTHNPHYYEYLRRVNNGQIPREAGDVPCGGLPNAYLFIRFIMDQQNLVLGEETKREIMVIHRCMSDIENYRMAQYPLRQPANVNRDLDILFLTNDIDEEKWGTSLERQETNFERRKEIGLIVQTLLHVGAEKLSALYNSATNAKHTRRRLFAEVLPEMNKVREFTNKSLWAKGRQMGMVVPQISDRWEWITARKSDIKNNAEPVVPNQNEVVEPEQGQEVQQNPVVTHHDNSDDEFVDNAPGVVLPEPVANAGAGQPQEMDTTDDMVYVEIDGEMVEMTRQQMRMLLE